MAVPRLVLHDRGTAAEARLALEGAGVSGAPVVDEAGRFEGTVTQAGIASHRKGDRPIGELTDPTVPCVALSSRLDSALESLMEAPLSWVSVLDPERRVVGTLSISDLLAAYRRELLASVARVNDLGTGADAFDLTITVDSPAAGQRLRAIGLHKGVLVTSITRGGEVVLPSGDTVVLAGDRLAALGERKGMERFGEVTSPAASRLPVEPFPGSTDGGKDTG